MAKLHQGKNRDLTSVPSGKSKPIYNTVAEMGTAPHMKLTPAKTNGIRSIRRTKAVVNSLYVG